MQSIYFGLRLLSPGMPMPLVRSAICAVVISVAVAGSGFAEPAPPSAPVNATERQELEIYRKAATSGPKAYQDYLISYYSQETELGQLTIQVLRWQVFAANV